jgi:hypothetical protein
MSNDTTVWKVTTRSQASGSGHGQHTSVVFKVNTCIFTFSKVIEKCAHLPVNMNDCVCTLKCAHSP